jgi:hypothetical protein
MKLTHAALWISLLLAGAAHAHKPSDSYLSLTTTTHSSDIKGQWDIALRDVEHAIGVDSDGDGAVTWGELRARESDLAQYAFAHLTIEGGNASTRTSCPIRFDQLLVDQHVDGAYAVLRFQAGCAVSPEQITLRYSLFFDLDPDHRGLLDLRTDAGQQALVFSKERPEAAVAVRAVQSWTQLRAFIGEGVWHILQGYDHVLFLFTLLLPAVVLYRDGRWAPRTSMRDSLLDVAKVVTAFTLAHSCTLSFAALGGVSLPTRFVESAIAFTVVLGALNNLRPVVTERRWLAAFVFGLIHGFGFASVLADLGLERASLAIALFGFNVGVELGQLAIVVMLTPFAYLLRASFFYRGVVMPAGAVLIGSLATYWFVVRAFDPSAT